MGDAGRDEWVGFRGRGIDGGVGRNHGMFGAWSWGDCMEKDIKIPDEEVDHLFDTV